MRFPTSLKSRSAIRISARGVGVHRRTRRFRQSHLGYAQFPGHRIGALLGHRQHALNWTRLSCSSFAANQVRFQLFLLAYNLSNFLRRIALPYRVREWSLTTLKEKLVKIGAKVVWHARYVTFQMAEVAVPHVLMKEILNRIRTFRVWKGAPQPG